VDMVAFVDPRKSKIDIAQAAGRAMRQSKATNKKLGYIVVPLFIEQKKGETEAEAFTRAGFDEVAEVLGAMLESDDDLVDTIEKMQEARGRGDKFNPRQLHDKIEVIGPAINLDKLTQSIDVEILEQLGISWDHWFGILQSYHQREGHCKVTRGVLANGLKLWLWIGNQRARKHQLTEDQIRRLDSLEFSWNPHADKWEEGFKELLKFREREGHCRVPQKLSGDGATLGAWVNSQRQKIKQLTKEQVTRLDSIGFTWDILTEKWEEGFEALLKFREREGHCRVAPAFSIDGFRLGGWARRQRSKRDELTPEQLTRLNSVGFSWDPFTEQWEETFTLLKKFHGREGHCNVIQSHEEDGQRLGVWASNQRKKRAKLSKEQVARMESLGFIWDKHDEQWNRDFEVLRKFREREGHCRVAHGTVFMGTKLGFWVARQRLYFSKMPLEKVERLNALGFIWKAKLTS
jgi:hypothetical protein